MYTQRADSRRLRKRDRRRTRCRSRPRHRCRTPRAWLGSRTPSGRACTRRARTRCPSNSPWPGSRHVRRTPRRHRRTCRTTARRGRTLWSFCRARLADGIGWPHRRCRLGTRRLSGTARTPRPRRCTRRRALRIACPTCRVSAARTGRACTCRRWDSPGSSGTRRTRPVRARASTPCLPRTGRSWCSFARCPRRHPAGCPRSMHLTCQTSAWHRRRPGHRRQGSQHRPGRAPPAAHRCTRLQPRPWTARAVVPHAVQLRCVSDPCSPRDRFPPGRVDANPPRLRMVGGATAVPQARSTMGQAVGIEPSRIPGQRCAT